jgi:hypothetical protein
MSSRPPAGRSHGPDRHRRCRRASRSHRPPRRPHGPGRPDVLQRDSVLTPAAATTAWTGFDAGGAGQRHHSPRRRGRFRGPDDAGGPGRRDARARRGHGRMDGLDAHHPRDLTLSPAAATVAWAGSTPTVVQGLTLTPAAGTVAWAGSTPTVQRDVTLTPAAATTAWAGVDPRGAGHDGAGRPDRRMVGLDAGDHQRQRPHPQPRRRIGRVGRVDTRDQWRVHSHAVPRQRVGGMDRVDATADRDARARHRHRRMVREARPGSPARAP